MSSGSKTKARPQDVRAVFRAVAYIGAMLGGLIVYSAAA